MEVVGTWPQSSPRPCLKKASFCLCLSVSLSLSIWLSDARSLSLSLSLFLSLHISPFLSPLSLSLVLFCLALSIYVYIYIYMLMLSCYYMVGGFYKLTTGPSYKLLSYYLVQVCFFSYFPNFIVFGGSL